MAQINSSVVSLRISGDDLLPENITEKLGCEPTKKQIKGQIFVGNKTGQEREAKTGMWNLHASDCKPENLDGQITEILNKLTSNLEVWSSISKQYKTDLFCGLFMDNTNEGLTISSDSLKLLGLRGIELGLDIYANCEDEQNA